MSFKDYMALLNRHAKLPNRHNVCLHEHCDVASNLIRKSLAFLKVNEYDSSYIMVERGATIIAEHVWNDRKLLPPPELAELIKNMESALNVKQELLSLHLLKLFHQHMNEVEALEEMKLKLKESRSCEPEEKREDSPVSKGVSVQGDTPEERTARARNEWMARERRRHELLRQGNTIDFDASKPVAPKYDLAAQFSSALKEQNTVGIPEPLSLSPKVRPIVPPKPYPVSPPSNNDGMPYPQSSPFASPRSNQVSYNPSSLQCQPGVQMPMQQPQPIAYQVPSYQPPMPIGPPPVATGPPLTAADQPPASQQYQIAMHQSMQQPQPIAYQVPSYQPPISTGPSQYNLHHGTISPTRHPYQLELSDNGELEPMKAQRPQSSQQSPQQPMRPLSPSIPSSIKAMSVPGILDFSSVVRATSIQQWAFPSSNSQHKRRGITNLGNTCYINSAIQCIAETPLGKGCISMSQSTQPLRTYTVGGGKILHSFIFVARELHFDSQLPVSASPLRRWIGSRDSTFDNFEQHDSAEFLRVLLDGIHEECNSKKGIPLPHKDIENHKRPDHVVAGEYLNNYQSSNDSIVSDLFSYQERSSIICKQCKNSSRSFNIQISVELSLPKTNGPTTLAECFAANSVPVLLDGDSKFNCPTCKTKCPAIKQVTFYSAPRVMFCHVLRYRMMFGYGNKVQRDVVFPLEFDLEPFIFHKSRKPLCYHLRGVVNHHGTINGGHYTAQVRSSLDNVWYDCSDEKTYAAKAPDFHNAYMLFYELQNAS